MNARSKLTRYLSASSWYRQMSKKKYILFEYLVNAIIALLWGIIAWRFLLLAKQTPTFSLLSWVSYYSFKLLKMNALKVDLWPCFLSLSLWFSFGKWVGEKFSWISVHTEPKSTSIFTKKFKLNFSPGESANLNFRLYCWCRKSLCTFQSHIFCINFCMKFLFEFIELLCICNICKSA